MSTVDYEVTDGGVVIRLTEHQGLDLTTPYDDPDKIRANVAWARTVVERLVDEAPNHLAQLAAGRSVSLKFSDDQELDLTAADTAAFEELVQLAPQILAELDDLKVETDQVCDVCDGAGEFGISRTQVIKCPYCDPAGVVDPAAVA